MKKKSVTTIVVLFSIALIGLLFSQWLWVSKSFDLKEEQLDHRIDMALNDVVEEFERYNDTTVNAIWIIDTLHRVKPKSILDIVDPLLLDTLLSKYMQYHHINLNFEYGIVKTCNDSVIYKTANFDMETDEYFRSCLSCLWQREIFHLAVIFPHKKASIITDFSLWVLLSIFFVMVVAGSFWYTVYTFVKQKKISEIRDDFVSNMTHEFKTPISTIQLTGEVLQKKLASLNDPAVNKYAGIILKENLRMRTQVERILQMAVLDKGEFKLNKTSFDLHHLIKSTVDDLCLEFNEQNVGVTYSLEASNNTVLADKVHISNILINLVQNSIKYTKEAPLINISTEGQNGVIKFSIKDNGIGMSQEKMKYVFDKFYRIPTGNIHDVKGFGLGLYYVKTMTEAHGGKVKVSSHLNKGSRFDVILPVGEVIEL